MTTILLGIITSYLLAAGLYNFRAGRSVPNSKLPENIPTVSLLIPARNETHAIANTLHRALSLDYPKLEIIVLDDKSRDSTPEKIRSFAQDGIRFVRGSKKPDGWIGKNWACEQLAEAASGEYMVFCDTDVLLSSEGFRRLVNSMVSREYTCVSVLPRLMLLNRWQASSFPLLHWLLMTLFQRSNKSHPVYGGLLAFKTSAYRNHGGWRHYRDRVLPEFKIAQDFARYDRYRFYNNWGMNFELLKKANSLIEARVRYLRPFYRHFPGLGLLHAITTLLPLILIASQQWWIYAGLVIGFSALLWRQTNYPLIVALMLPLICIVELIILSWSYWQHSRNSIAWKQRDISDKEPVTS